MEAPWCSYKTARKTIKGTKGYAAPEQYEGILTAPSDFYALGKTLQKLCGKKKYHYYIRSPQFAKFIHKCCRQDPDKRWQNAEEAEKYLAKINWKPFSLKSVLVPVCAALLTLLAVIHGAEQQPVLPEFQNALAAVTARFYSMEYQSSDKNPENFSAWIRNTDYSRCSNSTEKVKSRSASWNYWRGTENCLAKQTKQSFITDS